MDPSLSVYLDRNTQKRVDGKVVPTKIAPKVLEARKEYKRLYGKPYKKGNAFLRSLPKEIQERIVRARKKREEYILEKKKKKK